MTAPSTRLSLTPTPHRRSAAAATLAAAAALIPMGLAVAGDEPAKLAGDACGPACMHTDNASLEVALREYTRGAADPAARRNFLLDRIAASPMCFAPNMSPKQWDEALARFDFLPPGYVAQPADLRFFTDTQVWTGAGNQGSSGRAVGAQLTYSFPADGVTWGISGSGFPTGANALNARLTTVFTAANLDKGRELIRQAFGGWRRTSGLTYTEVADDNTADSTGIAHNPLRGDIRVGAITLDGLNGVLAYNYFPSGGSDMVIDAGDFVGNFNASGSNYLFYRNVVSHEDGHGLGYIHTVPCDNTKLMEPFAGTAFDMQQVDEIRAVQRNYGDRFTGNNSAANATDFGSLTSPILKSIIEKELSTNGVSGFNNSDEDWFKFTLGTTQNVVITVDPTGGSSTQGQQSSNCSGTTGVVNADQAGNLNVELRDAAGTTILMSSTGAAAGINEVITANSLAAGTYTVRVFDVGPNVTANQILQLYDLTIRVGVAKAPPRACAGVNKRIAANTNCFFMGNITSRVTEVGASITTYAWDLDGDGVFEIANNPQPSRTYAVNGTYPVTLRISDSNGLPDTDTILVTVFGGTSNVSITGVSPTSGMQGTTVPVTLTGTGLTNVIASSTVTVSGTGVTVTGTGVPNGTGTQVTGLSFNVAAGATLGARDITVDTVDGTDTTPSLFTVVPNVQPTVVSISPNFARQGYTVPVTITGTNFGNVTSASQVTITGNAGLTVVGTPVVGAGNTTITGLSAVAAIDAPNGTNFLPVTVTTVDGSGTLTMGFRVRCLADWDFDSVVTPSDVASFINQWTNDLSNGTLATDTDHDGNITPSDVATFVNAWFNALINGC